MVKQSEKIDEYLKSLGKSLGISLRLINGTCLITGQNNREICKISVSDETENIVREFEIWEISSLQNNNFLGQKLLKLNMLFSLTRGSFFAIDDNWIKLVAFMDNSNLTYDNFSIAVQNFIALASEISKQNIENLGN